MCPSDSGIVLDFGVRAAGFAGGGIHAGMGLPVSVAGVSGTDGGIAVLSGALSGGAIRDWAHTDQRRWFAGPEKGVHGQLLYRGAGGDRGHALHRTSDGTRHWLWALGTCRSDLCGVYGLGAGAGWPVCGTDAGAGLDTIAAEARRMDGSAATGDFSSHFCHGDLAGMGTGAGLRSWDSGSAAG